MALRRVLSFYKFFRLADPVALRDALDGFAQAHDLKGTILLATEGINGTVVGTPENLLALVAELGACTTDIPFKWSDLDEHNPGFYRLKVRVKPEIVSFGVPDLDITETGTPVDAVQWHALLEDPDVLVVDTRNSYEVDIGTFAGAVNPQTSNFREFPQWARENLNAEKHPRIAMFCTGGIRCEKASAYLKTQGFEQVYQLDGGILRYLEDVSPEENRWTGECFVFDQRVSVNADLEQGQYEQCFACRHPLSAEDLTSPEFEQGVSCPYCCTKTHTPPRISGLRERQRQVALAEARGERHIGQAQSKSNR